MIASTIDSGVRRGFWLAATASLALGLGACASDEVGRRALAETTTLRTQLDEIKQREENNSRELARIQSALRALEADAAEKTREVRAAGVEPAPVAPAPAPEAVAPPSPPPGPSIAPSGVPPHTVPVIPPRAAMATPPVAPAPPPAGAPRGAARSAQSAEQLFSAAMANFRAQEPGQAVLELTDLIARFPDHALAASAQLWIGEAYYQQRDYRQSLVELKRVLDGYPKSRQVADALLKTGLCHRALGDGAAARTAWEQVVREHSGSPAAGQARSLLGTRESAARGGR